LKFALPIITIILAAAGWSALQKANNKNERLAANLEAAETLHDNFIRLTLDPAFLKTDAPCDGLIFQASEYTFCNPI